MDNRVAIISLVVQDREAAQRVNQLLHEYAGHVIGRMGVPYPKRDISLISVFLDAPGDQISALSGKLGMIRGVAAKTVYAKVEDNP